MQYVNFIDTVCVPRKLAPCYAQSEADGSAKWPNASTLIPKAQAWDDKRDGDVGGNRPQDAWLYPGRDVRSAVLQHDSQLQ